tara:strand:- start:177 stop:392 length:216 start_codon:yes stop_codon:yes gene_type:complete
MTKTIEELNDKLVVAKTTLAWIEVWDRAWLEVMEFEPYDKAEAYAAEAEAAAVVVRLQGEISALKEQDNEK